MSIRLSVLADAAGSTSSRSCCNLMIVRAAVYRRRCQSQSAHESHVRIFFFMAGGSLQGWQGSIRRMPYRGNQPERAAPGRSSAWIVLHPVCLTDPAVYFVAQLMFCDVGHVYDSLKIQSAHESHVRIFFLHSRARSAQGWPAIRSDAYMPISWKSHPENEAARTGRSPVRGNPSCRIASTASRGVSFSGGLQSIFAEHGRRDLTGSRRFVMSVRTGA